MKHNASILKAAIVDDEKDLCFLLKKILERQNFHTTSVNSIQEADEMLYSLNPAVIFLDNQLPDGYGINFIPWIKKSLPKTRVVMMTAFNSESDKEEAFKNGADFFLMKPLSQKIIERTLNELNLKVAG